MEKTSILSYPSPHPSVANTHTGGTLPAQREKPIATGAYQKDIYKNVLKFPTETEHLKYFEKNPHPDKIPDKLLAISEAFYKQDLNINKYQKQIEFNRIKNLLEPSLSVMDKKLLNFPEKMDNWVVARYARKFGWTDYNMAFNHLKQCFYNFFTSPAKGTANDIQWIDYNFALRHPAARDAFTDLKANLWNKAAMKNLVEKLQKSGAIGDKKTDFYFWNTDPHNWSEISYQARSITYREAYASILSGAPQYMALGCFTINALPEGTVTPVGDGKYKICINKVYAFVNDTFNFEGFELLGFWNLLYRDEGKIIDDGFTTITNKSFRDFQRHGYGGYFPVLSRLHEIEDFKADCRTYQYAK